MGSGNSKPQGSQQYVFAADSPVSFSPAIVDSLQNSPESDSTRQRTQELLIQQRVTSELERIRDQEAARLAQYTQQLTSSDSSDSSDSDSSDSSSPSMTQKLSSAFSSNSSTSNDKKKDSLSNQSVSKEVNDLRSKLERRKMIGGGPENKELDAAKQNLVHCLRLNDRRPLDCWEQVETFKAEVAKLEQSFVNRALQ